MIRIFKTSLCSPIDYAAEELKKYLRMMMPECSEIDICYDPKASEGFRLGLMQDFGLDVSDAEDPVLDDILKFYQEKKLGQEYEAELEFFCVKILLCSSLERISRIRDVKLRNSFIKDTLGMIRERFPNYRKNPYMKHGKKQLYMKSMNGLTIYVWVWLLGIIRSK